MAKKYKPVSYADLLNPDFEYGNDKVPIAPKLLKIHDDQIELDDITQQRKKPFPFMEIVERLKLETETVLKDLSQNRNKKIEGFTIGKTYVDKLSDSSDEFDYLDTETWELDGILSRWRDYREEKDYAGMVILCAVTGDLIPEEIQEYIRQEDDAGNVLDAHQNYAIALEQQLIHYYAFVKTDIRLDNKTLNPGTIKKTIAPAYVVYLAFKLE